MKKNSKIVVFGGGGMFGSAVVKILTDQGFKNILTPTSSEVNLLIKEQADIFFKTESPDYVFMVAGLVGGIIGNKKRNADFLYQNTTMILNVLEAIKNYSSKSKILYTGSTCIYPRENPQPISEERFLAGPFEESNKGYAVAKSLGVVACELYAQQYGINCVAVMPTNMYGFNDKYDLENGHMIPSLIRRFLEAKKNETPVTLWGSGNPRREALFSYDGADAVVYLMQYYNSPAIVNIGTGIDYSIKDFAHIIANEVGYNGEIHWDTSKPEGVFEKRTDIARLKSIYPAYNPRSLQEGVREIVANKNEVAHIIGE